MATISQILFHKYQFGFRNNHSTVMALSVLFENLIEALDKSDCAIGIFLDLQKTFDTVNHNILLNKLYVYGIRGIAHEWFINYLSNRTQSVNHHECVSDPKTLKCGVPQGSILGPLLFLILYQWPTFCFHIVHANTFCRWYKPVLYWTKPWWFGTENKYRNGKDLFLG